MNKFLLSLQKKLFSRWLTAISLLVLTSGTAMAGVDPPVLQVLDGSLGHIKVDTTIMVEDAKFFDPAYEGVIAEQYPIKNMVAIMINEDANVVLQSAFIATIRLRINYMLNDSTTGTIESDFTLDYNAALAAYQQKNVYIFSNCARVEVKVISLTDNVGWDVWKALKVVNQLQSFPEFSFDCTNNAVTEIDDSLITAKDELRVQWDKEKAADEYDFEWTYIDSSALKNYRKDSDTTKYDPVKLFRHNATRVSIAAESYHVPLLYESRGYLFYRVRAVKVSSNGQRIESTWSSDYAQGLGQYNFAGHEDKLNWQASTSFAEEGKRKSVVQYFDGSLRTRQTVTKDNTTDTTIIAESYYDHQGRPVVQVLPAPSLSTILKYTPNFNSPLNGGEYTKDLYDGLLADSCFCAAGAPPMDSATGASQYYSPSNPLSNIGFHKFIPDARRYPFSETRYMPDNTGRIALQGGVDSFFQVSDTTYPTKFYYGAADQEELDALFGTEVGHYSHYFKNMVLDANRQFSVSYVDMHGRTIATGLAGSAPEHLDTLASNVTRTITKKLLDSSTNIVKGTTIESSKGLLVTKEGNHRFLYSLSPDSVGISDCDTVAVCYNCVYDLEIIITDDCNNTTLPGGEPIIITKTNLSYDTTCGNNTFPTVDTTFYLRQGGYLVTKKLTISKEGMDFYRDSVFLRRNTCKSLQDFIDEQKELLADLACEPSCEDCLESLGDFESFREQYMEEMGIPVADTASFRNKAMLAFKSLEEECDQLCDKTGLHQSIRQQMLADVSAPGGQYADPDDVDTYSIFAVKNSIAAYQSGIVYVDQNGDPDPTAPTLNRDQFAANFKSSWADSLLKLHPEYFKLLKYEELKESHIWDVKFERTETFAAAVDSGYLNPANFSGLPNTTIFQYNSAQRDPLFTDLEPGYKQRMLDSLKRKVIITSPADTISAWSLATIMAHCPTGDGDCMGSYTPISEAFNIPDSCSGDLDIAWQYFREMYLQEKREIINVILEEYHAENFGKDYWRDLTLLAQSRTLNFVDPNLFPKENLSSSPAVATDSLNRFIDSNCVAFAQLWWDELKPCGFSAADSATIISQLVAICKEGGDITHPFGASSVRPASTYAYRSFEQWLKFYCDTAGISYNNSCNVYLISAPALYEQQRPVNDKPILQKPDSCECAKISTYFTQYQNEAVDSSFSDFIYRTTGVRMYEGVLDTLVKVCNDEIDCSFLTESIMLPTVLQCGVDNTCIGCSQFQVLYKEYLQEFPGALPTYADNDSAQQVKNALFRRFMNRKLGFALLHTDYLNFLQACGIPPDSSTLFATLDTATVTCNQLDALVDEFYAQYFRPVGGIAELDMTTFAGNKTPLAGPKGVFDVDGNLLGKTVDGTTAQIDSSFAVIWNGSQVNKNVGKIYPAGNGKFRLHLNAGQQVPCNGINGMRYYEFNVHTDSIMRFLFTGLGSFIDFGDSTFIKTEHDLSNSHTISDKRTTLTTFRVSSTSVGSDFVVPTHFAITHFYPVNASRVTYAATIYHTDTLGYVGFQDHQPAADSTMFSNLQGYIPQHTLQFLFRATRDSTINRSREIRNFSQISSMNSIQIHGLVTVPLPQQAPLIFNNFGSFENNHGLRYLRLDAAYDLIPNWPSAGVVDAVAGNHYQALFPNLPVNFPDLRIAYLSRWKKRESDYNSFSFELPDLKLITLGDTLPSGYPDTVYNQIARVTTVTAGLTEFGPPAPTAASSTSRTALINAGWYLNHSGLSMGVPGFTSDLNAVDTSLSYEHPFTAFANQKLGVSLTWRELKLFYKAKCGYIPDFCESNPETGPTLCGKKDPMFPTVQLRQPGPCNDSLLFAVSVGTLLYEAYRDSIINSFNDNYLKKCLQARNHETFTVEQPINEYHYTLYYYDLAGNLVKTIPPSGVNISKFGWMSSWSDSVKAARAAKQSLTPQHELPTRYRYNTLNQVVAQKSPDGGLTEFWYDRLGRLTLSRNAKQLAASTSGRHIYSYTNYDQLGRIAQVGQIRETTPSSSVNDALTRDESSLQNWFGTYNNYRHQVTQTVYDAAYFTMPYSPLNLVQRNLRNRVSYLSYTEDTTGAATAFNAATFYTYDIAGNVDTLLQDYGCGDCGVSKFYNMMNRNGNRWKKIVYNYDLISGKVNNVAYQRGYTDQFFQRYSYDTENRLILAESSRDSVLWEREARYEYYRHGPLARMVLGDQQVQGVDYAYTLQGWLKGINSTGGTATHDIGGDGLAAGVNQYTARDAIGTSLNYFAADYRGVGFGVMPFPSPAAGLNADHRPLYNGNISSMSVYNKRLGDVGAPGGPLLLYNYRYDQLNRLKGMNVFTNFTGNDWNGALPNAMMKERITYDPNGNILSYDRNYATGTIMDSLKYSYYPNTNRLNRITDVVSDGAFPGSDIIYDIDNQAANNYVYDEIGNLIRDVKEQIDTIKWNVYGKITEIVRSSSGSVPVTNIKYFYDALGNRIGKVFDLFGNKRYTWYVRDAQGNVLSIYNDDNGGTLSLHELTVQQAEQYLYGSSRLGMIANGQEVDNSNAGPGSMQYFSGGLYVRGKRNYELTNHLGNVLAVVTDKKIGVSSGSSLYDYYNADIVSATDFYPFGMAARVTVNLTNYTRFGFNGKEFDWEVKAWQNQYDYGFRVYDPRIGKFLSVDPLTKNYPWYTPYQFAGNSPITNIDLDGLEEARANAISDGAQQYADEKKAQGRGILRYFLSGQARRDLTSYGKDWGKAVTGDRAAIHRVNEKTTKTITQASNALANGITEPAVFLSTMHTRSKYENIKGGTYYGLKALELYATWRFFDAMEEGGASISSRGRIGAEEILPNGQRGVWVEEITAGRSANSIDYQSAATGLRPGVAIEVNGVRFDDLNFGRLIDAKGSYGKLVNNKTGEFYDWFKNQGGKTMVDDAIRQIKAAKGNPIDWKFQDKATLNATKSWLESQGIKKGINYIHEPNK